MGYNESRLKSTFRNSTVAINNDLVYDYKFSLAHMLNDLFHTVRFYTTLDGYSRILTFE
jgi:hypothetical protein